MVFPICWLVFLGMLAGTWARTESVDSFQAGDLVEIHTPGEASMEPDVPRIRLGQIEEITPHRVRFFVFVIS